MSTTQLPQPAPVAAIDIPAEIEAGTALIRALPGVKDFALIGSAAYLPDANDVDFAVLIDAADGAADAINYTGQMQNDGWGNCGEYDGVGGIWAAVRRENLNLMVTHDQQFFDDYKRAMEVCKALRLRHKEDRVAVCQIVRDRKPADEVYSHARLYGADRSPDAELLEALQCLVARYEFDGIPNDSAAVVATAKALIAKATGAAS
jgi:hypothetical protein